MGWAAEVATPCTIVAAAFGVDTGVFLEAAINDAFAVALWAIVLVRKILIVIRIGSGIKNVVCRGAHLPLPHGADAGG